MNTDKVNALWVKASDDSEGMRLGYTMQHHYFAALIQREMEGAHQICELCNQHYDQHAYDRLFDSRFICPDRKGVFRSKRHTKTVEPVATVYDAYDTTGIDWHCRHPPAAGAKLYDQTAIDSLQTALQRVREERDKCAMMNDDQSRRVYAAEEKVRRMVELMKEPTEQGAQMSNFSGNGFDAKG